MRRPPPRTIVRAMTDAILPPQHHVPRHLSQLGFVTALAAGAGVYYGIKPSHAFALVGAIVVWYVVGAGVRYVLTQPHPRAWAAYVATVPITTGVVAAVGYVTLDSPPLAALIGMLAAPAVQWLVAQLFLRAVVEDKARALRRRAGLV